MSHPFLGPMGAVPPPPLHYAWSLPTRPCNHSPALASVGMCFWELPGTSLPFTCIQMFIEHL